MRKVAILQGDTKILWINLSFYADDLSRLDLTRKRLLSDTGLNATFCVVRSEEKNEVRLEQTMARSFTHRPSDVIPQLVRGFRDDLWATALQGPPFRHYYVYVCPSAERAHVLPQLAAIYAVMFYLGSITRYRPQQFDALVQGRFGGPVQEILASQPGQFLYLIASEFAQREVTHPAIA